MTSEQAADEWCVQLRSGPDAATEEHWVADVDAFLTPITTPVQVRFTHGSSRYLDRFRDLRSAAVSPVSGVRYTEFGWRTHRAAAGAG